MVVFKRGSYCFDILAILIGVSACESYETKMARERAESRAKAEKDGAITKRYYESIGDVDISGIRTRTV